MTAPKISVNEVNANVALTGYSDVALWAAFSLIE